MLWGFQRDATMADELWRKSLLPSHASLERALRSLDETSLKIVIVTGSQGELLGTLTDGDVRRALIKGASLESRVERHMNRNPVAMTNGEDQLLVQKELERLALRAVPIIDADRRVLGVVGPSQPPHAFVRETPALIMAGGRGSRLQPLTDSVPKPLLRIAGETMLDILVRRLVAAGFRQIWVSVGYLASVIQDHLGNGSDHGAQISYIIEDEPRGTAGAVRDVPVMSPASPILVCNADTIHGIDFGALVDFHVGLEALATLAVVSHESEVPYGVVNINGSKITSVVEKPVRTHWVASGVSVLTHRALNLVGSTPRIDVPTVISELLSRNLPVGAFKDFGYWIDVGTPDSLRRAHHDHNFVRNVE